VLAFSSQVRGFKLGRRRRNFQGEKILSTTSFGGEVNPSVSCRRFAACKRSLNVTWKLDISGKIHRPFLAHRFPTLAVRISKRRLVVTVGTSKGSTINQHGCSTSGALATGALQKERKKARRSADGCFSSVTFGPHIAVLAVDFSDSVGMLCGVYSHTRWFV
jgi:hypothetical protein